MGQFRGAMVYRAMGEQRILPGEHGISPIIFDTTIYDTDNFWDATLGRFIVPLGVSHVRLSAQAVFATALPEDWQDSAKSHQHLRQIVIKKNSGPGNNGFNPGCAVGQLPTHRATTADVQAIGPVLEVLPGDQFLVDAFVLPVACSIKGSTGTWFAIEVVA